MQTHHGLWSKSTFPSFLCLESIFSFLYLVKMHIMISEKCFSISKQRDQASIPYFQKRLEKYYVAARNDNDMTGNVTYTTRKKNSLPSSTKCVAFRSWAGIERAFSAPSKKIYNERKKTKERNRCRFVIWILFSFEFVRFISSCISGAIAFFSPVECFGG